MQSNENHVDMFCTKSVQQNSSLTLGYKEKNPIFDKLQP